MPKQLKYDKILDALQKLLETKELSNISVSEIAQTAEIGKGSIYYYFSSNCLQIFFFLFEKAQRDDSLGVQRD